MKSKICPSCNGSKREVVSTIEITPADSIGNRVFRSFRDTFGGSCPVCQGKGRVYKLSKKRR